ncbi:hypothetical protein FI667_g14857, partial [Globisporangium splendens]
MKHNCDDHQDAALLPAVCGHHTAHHKTPRCLRSPYRAAQDPPLSAATTPRSTRPPAVCGHHTAQHKTPRCLRPPYRAAQDPLNRAYRLCESRRDRSIEARRSQVQVRLTKHSQNAQQRLKPFTKWHTKKLQMSEKLENYEKPGRKCENACVTAGYDS